MKANESSVINVTNTTEMIETKNTKVGVIEAVVGVAEDVLEEIIVHANQGVMLKHLKVEAQLRNNRNNNKLLMLHLNQQLHKLKLAFQVFC